jgi:hypothetical protein
MKADVDKAALVEDSLYFHAEAYGQFTIFHRCEGFTSNYPNSKLKLEK